MAEKTPLRQFYDVVAYNSKHEVPQPMPDFPHDQLDQIGHDLSVLLRCFRWSLGLVSPPPVASYDIRQSKSYQEAFEGTMQVWLDEKRLAHQLLSYFEGEEA